jgi:hypothetical protein
LQAKGEGRLPVKFRSRELGVVIELGQTVYGRGVGSELEALVILPKLEHLGTWGFADV